ncbi:tripartite tricarboxylate transporter TctB family protein [Ruegeria sp. SCSIO 43209]|uniref:tripartite tricarboxylate transporter TctB family protein n=1 Tax=Ruegeria sp. SCSIO 43209 TaxID=2793010 RepID=UPI00147F1713|nr:tripartite tricarboxylate transporter TctB family protein [Ruegeria sp. SCSIO 43209]UAB88085.1 tripartite tricarboxylate transporter TctB family protein [Ruegeria sp. SCSIO 43209]
MRAYAEGLVLALISIFAIWGAWQVPAASPGDTWAGIVPFSAALALLALSGVMVLIATRQTAGDTSDDQDSNATLQIIGLFIIAMLYQQSFRWFGYLLPTAIVTPIVLYIFGVRSRIGLVLSIVLCPLVFHLIFFVLLGVYPPYGEVFDLLSWIQG